MELEGNDFSLSYALQYFFNERTRILDQLSLLQAM
jgi:hypothetical protein